MNVIFEFLSEEPLDNVITCMRFAVDKAIFIGYHDTIEKQKHTTKDFLMNECGVQEVVFHALSQDDLQSVLKQMSLIIDRERADRNRIFFDITGGESLILVAFGMLAEKYKAPMHIFDVEEDVFVSLNPEVFATVMDQIPERQYHLNLDQFIRLRGGIITDRPDSSLIRDPEQKQEVEAIWSIMERHDETWNPFSIFMREHLSSGINLDVSKSARWLLDQLSEYDFEHFNRLELNRMLDELESAGILSDVQYTDGKYRFRYKNDRVQEILWSGGRILELHMFYQQAESSTDCRVGVHLDWDGVVNPPDREDVLNEIDVLALHGNVPVFISCKSGRMDSYTSLFALYELETVARRFGGRYAKKILVTMRELGDAYLERAKEMGIQVVTPGK